MKAALINDISGLGRCSLVAGISVLSAMGVTACPMPTAVLSAQTAYPAFSRLDMTADLPDYIGKWQAVGASFDGILTGYMTGEKQAEIIKNFVSFSLADVTPQSAGRRASFVLVDPVMGDDGRAYSNFTEGLCRQLKSLAGMADVITPNLTELWLLTGGPLEELRGAVPETDEIIRRAQGLLTGRCQTVAVTGIRKGEEIGSLVVTPEDEPKLSLAPRCPQSFCGTGDVFAAIVFGGLLKGTSPDAVFGLAARFISEAAMSAHENGATANDGIDYEKMLGRLAET